MPIAYIALDREGIVSKRLGYPYRSSRVNHWLKIKNSAAPAVKREADEDWERYAARSVRCSARAARRRCEYRRPQKLLCGAVGKMLGWRR